MKAPGNVTKWLSILQETVVFEVDDERSRFRVTYCANKDKEEDSELQICSHRDAHCCKAHERHVIEAHHHATGHAIES